MNYSTIFDRAAVRCQTSGGACDLCRRLYTKAPVAAPEPNVKEDPARGRTRTQDRSLDRLPALPRADCRGGVRGGLRHA
ncbi:hypothetical protein HOE425_320281 [Hoeflea sp. EC-HK425]|nr:hypothetical protein HOE425_320281 [Hoeflea sp. EC-HK425]